MTFNSPLLLTLHHIILVHHLPSQGSSPGVMTNFIRICSIHHHRDHHQVSLTNIIRICSNEYDVKFKSYYTKRKENLDVELDENGRKRHECYFPGTKMRPTYASGRKPHPTLETGRKPHVTLETERKRIQPLVNDNDQYIVQALLRSTFSQQCTHNLDV